MGIKDTHGKKQAIEGTQWKMKPSRDWFIKTEFSARLLVQVLLPKVWRTIFQLDKQMLYTASLRIK